MGSTDFANRPVEPRQQSTMKWKQSKTNLINRSSGVWYDSKDRCHQSTMEMWHKSADKWHCSKDRCQQSVKGILYRSATRWNESTDRLHMAARIQNSEEKDRARQGQIEKQDSSPSPRSQPNSPQTSQSLTSRYYSQSIKTSPSESSSSSPDLESSSTAVKSPNRFNIAEPTLSPEEHIAGLWEASGRVKCVVTQTAELRNEKLHALGEIEGEWISSTIADAESAANDLSSFVDPLWHQSNKIGGLTLKERKNWKRRDCQNALKKETRMTLCYERLETVFGHLKTISPTSELAATEKKEEATVTALESPPVVAVAAGLPCPTTVISTIELPCSTTTLKLQTERDIPKIVVTQYDGDDDDTSPDHDDIPNFPPPSYEAGEVKKDDELFFS